MAETVTRMLLLTNALLSLEKIMTARKNTNDDGNNIIMKLCKVKVRGGFEASSRSMERSSVTFSYSYVNVVNVTLHVLQLFSCTPSSKALHTIFCTSRGGATMDVS